MKILKLISNNIKKIKVVELSVDQDKNLIMITGKNAQGKSSLLDSIWIALGGKKATPDLPIREGEDEASVELNIDNYIIKKTITKTGSYLKIWNPKGEQFSNPQEFLDFILGTLTFDPLLFSRLEPKKQIEELCKIVDLDFTDWDENKKTLSNERLLVGREIKKFPVYQDEVIERAKQYANSEEVSVLEINEKLQKAQSNHQSYLDACNKIASNNLAIERLKQQIETMQNENSELSKIEDTKENIAQLKNDIATADETNKQIRQAKDVVANLTSRKEKQEEYNSLTKQLETIEFDKKSALSDAKMPIKGLSFDEENVLFNNIPYGQLSSAEQLKVSMAIAMAGNPKLKVIIIKDGSLLDKTNLAVLEEMAKENDFQVWIESVDDSGGVGIVIEDGQIKSINT